VPGLGCLLCRLEWVTEGLTGTGLPLSLFIILGEGPEPVLSWSPPPTPVDLSRGPVIAREVEDLVVFAHIVSCAALNLKHMQLIRLESDLRKAPKAPPKDVLSVTFPRHLRKNRTLVPFLI